MHEIASGLPMDCVRGEDYTCSHASFLHGLREFARADAEDVIFRAEPLLEGKGLNRRQIGLRVQYFWNLHRSGGDAIPEDFAFPDDEQTEPSPALSPYAREKYAEIPWELRPSLAMT